MNNKVSQSKIVMVKSITLSEEPGVSGSLCSARISISGISAASCVDSKTPLIREKGLS